MIYVALLSPQLTFAFADPFDRPASYSLKAAASWEADDYGDSRGPALFWRKMASAYRYLPAKSKFVECARIRWNSTADCMTDLLHDRYVAYWAEMLPQEYDLCCQPTKATICIEPELVDDLPLCGFPFGSVDHLPAFLPELTLSLPSGFFRVMQGIGDDDLECSSEHQCRLRPFAADAHLEARLLWSTSLAVYLDTIDLSAKPGTWSAIDLGAGVGLTCVVLSRKGSRVTCTDVDEVAVGVAAQNAKANNVALRALQFNYTTPRDTWPVHVSPPYDVVVLGAIPQDELRKNLPTFARLLHALGRRGARAFLEDQSYIPAGQRSWADAPEAWALHGLMLMHAFNPCAKGIWPMPEGRIYDLAIV